MRAREERVKVLLVGGTGQLGGRIARELLSKGMAVRALCRRGSGSGALARMGAEIVSGDLKEPASLSAACAGADIVVTTANGMRRGGDDTVDAVDLTGTRALMDAAMAAHVGRFVYVSAWGATPASPVPLMRAKAANEEYLKSSGLAWTVLAPNAFMESWPGLVVGGPALAGRDVVIVGTGRTRHAFIAEHDVAQFAMAAVMDDRARNRYLPLGGPEAHSWLDVVTVYEEALGRPVPVRHVTPDSSVEGVPPALLSLLAGQDTYESVFDTSALASEFGVRQTPLAAWVRASIGSRKARV